MRALRWTFAARRAWAIAALGLLVYATLYLLAARGIVIDDRAGFARFAPLPVVQVTADLSPRYLTDVVDPVAVVYLTDAVALAPTLPALVVATLLGGLLGANLAVSVETLVRRPPGCERPETWWAAAALPSFLASFSCCAPTVLLVLGANFAAAVIAVVPFVVPLAFALMTLALWWALRRLERTTVLAAW